LGEKIDWDAPGLPRLWQYNLHYFDYLIQPELNYSSGLALIRSWIKNHPPQAGAVGWEPYPISLRLLNWIKFFSAKANIPDDILASLLLQAINLSRQIEYHLGGNHLWVNGKALWFAGTFLQEPHLACLGKKIIFKEISRQFLPDGGHFELSSMYHAILTEDLLDLINLCQTVKGTGSERELENLNSTAIKSLAWLAALIDRQGKFPLLNDAVYGEAPTYHELCEYGKRLGGVTFSQEVPKFQLGSWSGRSLSGYRVFANGPFRLVWDTAPLGPDHLLGHAHCDMLSVLLDFEGQNILTDTGVSQYEDGEQRQYERGTSAHNTVVLDGLEQAELWKSFRVGRRGHPINFNQKGRSLSCSHTGFEIWRPGLQHERMLTLHDNGFELTDYVTGPGDHQYQAFFHFAPEVQIEAWPGHHYLINQQLLIETWGAEAKLATSQYSPEFGRVLTRPCLVLQGEFHQQHSFGLKFSTREKDI
jgi:uncharacterized heparinase superfamily protein